MIAAKKLQAEIEESLLRGLEIFLSQGLTSIDDLRNLMRERANNLAQAYAGRVLSDEEVAILVFEVDQATKQAFVARTAASHAERAFEQLKKIIEEEPKA